jgi:hypothetical protein
MIAQAGNTIRSALSPARRAGHRHVPFQAIIVVANPCATVFLSMSSVGTAAAGCSDAARRRESGVEGASGS